MRKAEKIAICFMFLLGSFVCFASLYRIITIIRLTETTDISWAKSDVFIWSSVEPSVGIISGCLPTMHALAIHVLAKFGIDTSHLIARPAPKPQQEPNSWGNVTPLETISKKRTRKIGSKWGLSILEPTQFSRLGEDEARTQTAPSDREEDAQHLTAGSVWPNPSAETVGKVPPA
jgi:hypothetical protein